MSFHTEAARRFRLTHLIIVNELLPLETINISNCIIMIPVRKIQGSWGGK